MSLKDFFLEKIGVSEEYWEDCEGELGGASEKAARRNLENIYGRDRLDSFSPGVEERIAEGIEEKDEYLGFLAIEILESELERKDVILESLTGLAFESLSTYNYPIMDVMSHMIREIEGVGEKHPKWFGWEDTFSSRESFENVFEWVMESDFDVPKKTSVFVCMIVSLKEAKMRDLAKKITTLFFRSGEISRKVKELIGRKIMEGEFLNKVQIGVNRDSMLASLEESPPEEFSEEYVEGLRRQLGSSFIVEVGENLERTNFSGGARFTVEKRIVTKWGALYNYWGSCTRIENCTIIVQESKRMQKIRDQE